MWVQPGPLIHRCLPGPRLIGESPPPQATAISTVSTVTAPANSARNISLPSLRVGGWLILACLRPIANPTDSWDGIVDWPGESWDANHNGSLNLNTKILDFVRFGWTNMSWIGRASAITYLLAAIIMVFVGGLTAVSASGVLEQPAAWAAWVLPGGASYWFSWAEGCSGAGSWRRGCAAPLSIPGMRLSRMAEAFARRRQVREQAQRLRYVPTQAVTV